MTRIATRSTNQQEFHARSKVPFYPNLNARQLIALTDGLARANLGASINPDGYQDEVEIVGNMTIPLMIVHGEKEQLVNADYIAALDIPTLWNDEIQFIADAGHAPHWETPKKFNKLLTDFVTDIMNGNAL